MEVLFLFSLFLFTSLATGMTMFIKPRWVANLIAPHRQRPLSKTIKTVGFVLTFISLIAVALAVVIFTVD